MVPDGEGSTTRGPRSRWRGRASTALAVVACISLFVGIVASWAQSTLFDSNEFANRAVASLNSASVRQALAERITDALSGQAIGSLTSFRPALLAIVEELETTEAFRGIFHDAVEQTHHAVFERHAARALLELGDLLTILSTTTAQTNSDLANRLPSQASSLLIDATPMVNRLKLWRVASGDRWVDDLAWGIAAAAAVGALILEARRRTVVKLGLAVAGAGVGVISVALMIPRVAARRIWDASLAKAVSAIATGFVADLRAIGIWLIPIGLIVAAAGRAGDEPHPVHGARRLGERILAIFSTKAPRPQRLGAGAVLVGGGLLLIVYREGVVPIGFILLGAAAAYLGAVFILSAVLGPAPATAHHPLGVPHRPERRPALRHATFGVGVVAVAALSVTGLVTSVNSSASHARASAELRCNGYAVLCDRPLNEVAFAGAHNAMSAATSPGWLFAENDYGIPSQLEYGVRALLLKSHYGIPTGINVAGSQLVVTDRASEINANKDAETAELSPEAVARAQELEKLAPGTPTAHQVYLCHVYCALGATKMSDVLSDVKAFIERNPDEVVMLFIGDFISPADTAKQFQDAGLIDRIWTYDTNAPPPTLRQMITAKRNLMVLSENFGGTPAWLTKGYGIFQDTPFTFAEPGDFSCVHNRGPTDAPLFQINHWITNKRPPSPQLGRIVNSYDTLLAAVEKCEDQRGRFPTIVGVNFYDQGDLMAVVNHINGVGDR